MHGALEIVVCVYCHASEFQYTVSFCITELSCTKFIFVICVHLSFGIQVMSYTQVYCIIYKVIVSCVEFWYACSVFSIDLQCYAPVYVITTICILIFTVYD